MPKTPRTGGGDSLRIARHVLPDRPAPGAGPSGV